MNALKYVVQTELCLWNWSITVPFETRASSCRETGSCRLNQIRRLPECVFTLSVSPRFDVSHEFVTYVLTDVGGSVYGWSLDLHYSRLQKALLFTVKSQRSFRNWFDDVLLVYLARCGFTSTNRFSISSFIILIPFLPLLWFDLKAWNELLCF